jgi:hypothetical protein
VASVPKLVAVVGALPLLATALAGTPAPADEDGIGRALAWLPAEVRVGLKQVVIGPRACAAADPFAEVRVDVGAGRIELCRGADEPAREQQVVFGALLLFDARTGWSRQPDWRRLNGSNEAPEAYAAASARRSSAWELASFAAAWIAERAAAAGSGADAEALALTCRLLPQAVFVHGQLQALTAVPQWLRAPPRCRAFEAWARRDHLARVEVVLASPSTVTMASMFGHVFLRLVSRAPEVEGAAAALALALDDRTLAFLVDNQRPVEEERLYALKGIAGAYRATLVERSLLETYRNYVVVEGRDLRRYELRLSPGEREALLRRLWSLKQAGRFRYTFFGRNCATLMVDLINGVLPEQRQARPPQALTTTPAGTLEGYAGARAADGGPLLAFIPGSLLSFEHEARRAALARRPWLPPGAAGAALTSLDPEVRAAGYRRLVARVPASASSREGLRRFLRASAVIEAHLGALANLEQEQALARRQRAALHTEFVRAQAQLGRRRCVAARAQVIEAIDVDDPARRHDGYRELRALVEGPCAREPGAGDDLRRAALLASALRYDGDDMDPGVRDVLLFPARARTLGEQPFAAGLAGLLDHPFVTRVSSPLLALQQAMVALGPGEGSAGQWRRDEVALQVREERAFEARALPYTGIDQVHVGMAVRPSGAGAETAPFALVLGGAMHDERIGDQRRFGFPSHTALTVMRSETSLLAGTGRPRFGAWKARVIGYRSLRPALSLGAITPRPGGELAVDLVGRPQLGRALDVRAGGGWVVPLLASADLANHLMVSAGPLATMVRPTRSAASGTLWSLGASAALEARLAPTAHPGVVLGAAASYQPQWSRPAGPFVQDLAARAEAEIALISGWHLPRSRVPRGLAVRLGWELFASTRGRGVDAGGHEQRLLVSLAVE